jgi:hypothetical protein
LATEGEKDETIVEPGTRFGFAMRTLRRSLSAALIAFLAFQAFGPLVQAAPGCGATASMGAGCQCCRRAGAAGCPMCKRSHGIKLGVRSACRCGAESAQTLTVPSFGRVAVLPDPTPGFIDPALSSFPARDGAIFLSITRVPPSPPPWRLSTTSVPSCSRA